LGTLGDGVNTAYLFTQGGRTQIDILPGATEVGWGRNLSAISAASVKCVVPGGQGRAECCRVLGNVHTWQHELVVFRNGRRVWEGPVVRVGYQGDSVTIDAADVLGWTRRRKHTGRTATNVKVLDELNRDIAQAFAPHDPNVIAYKQVLNAGTGATVDRDVKAGSGYFAEDLDQLADQGANYTVNGRRIILWPDETSLGQVSRLIPELHLVADVEVIEDGMLLATEVTARNDDAVLGVSTQGPAVDPFYGLVQGLTEAATVKNGPGLIQVATRVRAKCFPAPTLVNVPDGATLTCDAPYDITELVPGVLIPIATNALCRDVSATQMLSSVEVRQTADGGENVNITLVPMTASYLAAATEVTEG
jgi:hypothetical protein